MKKMLRTVLPLALIAIPSATLRASDMGGLVFVMPFAMFQLHGGARFPIGGTRDLAGTSGWDFGFDFNALRFSDSMWTLRPTVTYSDRIGASSEIPGRPKSELTSREIGLECRYYFRPLDAANDWSAGPYFIVSACSSRSSYKIDKVFAAQNNIASQYVTDGLSYGVGMGYQVTSPFGIEVRINTLPISIFNERRLDRTIALSVVYHPLEF